MRRNICSLLVFFIAIFLFLSFFPVAKFAYAGAPRLGECIDERQDRRVSIDYQENLKTFANVAVSASDPQRYEIQVNPTHFYLGRETQQWLFYRQCGRINMSHDSVQSNAARISLQEDREADCWAIRHMLEENIISYREVGRIQRDIELLEEESNNWRAIFGARRSRVNITECL